MNEYGALTGRVPGIGQYVGWSMFAAGFLLETVADHQKLVYKQDSKNADKFIDHGLWSVCRHPNYLGEIVLWWGLYISAVSAFSPAGRVAAVTAVGPLFVTYLLGNFSMNMLERSSRRKYGALPGYVDYTQRVKRLIPFLW